MRSCRSGYTLAEWLLLIALCGIVLTSLRWFLSLTVPPPFMRSMGLTGDGRHLVARFAGNTIKVWHAESRQWSEFPQSPRALSDLQVSPRGSLLAAAFGDGTIVVWDLDAGKTVRILGEQRRRNRKVAFSADGRKIAAANVAFDEANIWDVATGKLEATIAGNGALATAVSFARGGRSLVVHCFGARARSWADVYDIASGRRTATYASGSVQPQAISRDGERIALRDTKGSIVIRDLETGKVLKTLFPLGPPLAMSFSPDGQTLAIACGTLELLDVSTGVSKTAALGSGPFSLYVAFTADGHQLAAGDLYGNIVLRDANSLQIVEILRDAWAGHSFPYFSLAGAAWVILWILVRRSAKTRVCADCGCAFRRLRRSRDEVCPDCHKRSLSPAQIQREQVYTAAKLLPIGLFVAWIVVAPLLSLATPVPTLRTWQQPLFVLPLTIGIAILGLITAIVLLKLRLKRLYQQAPALSLARTVAREEGTVTQFGPVTLWFPGTAGIGPRVGQHFDRVAARIVPFLGERPAARQPLLILAFAKPGCLAEFCRRMSAQRGDRDGIYQYRDNRLIMISLEPRPNRLAHPQQTLDSLVAFYLLDCWKHYLPPFWLSRGIGRAVAGEGTPGASARLNRHMLAALDNGHALDVHKLFFVSGWTLSKLVSRWYQHDAFARYELMVAQAWSVVDYLAGPEAPQDRRARFQAFLKALQEHDQQTGIFVEHFGYGYQRLLYEWESWVRQHGPGEHEPPPPSIQQALRDRILPLIQDPRGKILDRILAIRDMGRTGYACGAEALVDLVRRRDRVLMREAIWALEAIAGRALGEDAEAWDAWLDSLPPEVSGITEGIAAT